MVRRRFWVPEKVGSIPATSTHYTCRSSTVRALDCGSRDGGSIPLGRTRATFPKYVGLVTRLVSRLACRASEAGSKPARGATRGCAEGCAPLLQSGSAGALPAISTNAGSPGRRRYLVCSTERVRLSQPAPRASGVHGRMLGFQPRGDGSFPSTRTRVWFNGRMQRCQR